MFFIKIKIKIPCLDIVELVKAFRKEDFVFLKIDIEGAENELLTQLIQRGALDFIDYIAVEYHPYTWNMERPEFESKINSFNSILISAGVKFIQWL